VLKRKCLLLDKRDGVIRLLQGIVKMKKTLVDSSIKMLNAVVKGIVSQKLTANNSK
jgi:hypothetical protein